MVEESVSLGEGPWWFLGPNLCESQQPGHPLVLVGNWFTMVTGVGSLTLFDLIWGYLGFFTMIISQKTNACTRGRQLGHD